MSRDEYKVTIGLEIHAELKTQTKMFCNSKNDPDEERPNVNICPVCMGYPGTLPVINKEAVKQVIKVGLALGGQIADFTEFDRKNYFYPDIPKGYQISQYKYPLVSGGSLNGISITRVHLEEDTARSTHSGNQSLIDFNRAGVPLMELVTDPVIHNAEDASAFAKELQLLLIYLGASEANMEKGEMRVEANISVSKTADFGTKVEVKNLNSFRAVERAIAYEVERHINLIEGGEPIIQETRGWDESNEVTFSQRTKEDSHDYRYFPDPDLPKLYISEISDLKKEHLLSHMPELPWQRRQRLLTVGIKKEDVEVYVRNRNWGDYFDLISKIFSSDSNSLKTASNYICSDLIGLVKGANDSFEAVDLSSKISPDNFSKLIQMLGRGEVSSRGAKDLLKMMYGVGEDVETLAKAHDLYQKSDEGELEEIAKKIISENEKAILEYKAGKEASLQFLIGQGMKVTKGSGNPEILKQIFKRLLS